MDYSFQFTVKSNYNTVAEAIRKATQICGNGCKERPGGEFSFRISGLKFFLYVSESNDICTLRLLLKNNGSTSNYILQAYDRFLISLVQSGLDIPVVPGKPYIVTTVAIGGGIEQKYTSSQPFSVGGAVVGGFLFGDLGAIVGGYGGTRKGQTKSFLSNSALFLLCYSNGMIEEKEVKKNTKLYAEVMAKLNADPVIPKRPISADNMENILKENQESVSSILGRVIPAIICVSLIAWLLGYFPSSKKHTTQRTTTVTTETYPAIAEKESEEKEKKEMILDNNFVSISFNKVEPTFGIEGFYVYLDIENKTENKTLWIYLDEGSVNGKMCSAVMNAMPVYITPGNTSKNPFIFPAQEHIEEVTKLQFRINVADKDTMSDYFYSDLITIDLS